MGSDSKSRLRSSSESSSSGGVGSRPGAGCPFGGAWLGDMFPPSSGAYPVSEKWPISSSSGGSTQTSASSVCPWVRGRDSTSPGLGSPAGPARRSPAAPAAAPAAVPTALPEGGLRGIPTGPSPHAVQRAVSPNSAIQDHPGIIVNEFRGSAGPSDKAAAQAEWLRSGSERGRGEGERQHNAGHTTV